MNLSPEGREFINRWRQKSEQYKFNHLTDCFDRFFTAYVLYNFLYNWISKHEKYVIKKGEPKAVLVAIQYLGAATFFDDTILKQEGTRLLNLIETKTFTLGNPICDLKLSEMLRSSDACLWSGGLFEIIYAVRCNLFHGEKDFNEEQRKILEPSTRILEKINDMLIQKLAA